MSRQQIIVQTNAFLIQSLDIDAALITPDTELKRDIGITSVDATAIASFMQQTFGCTIVMREIKAIVTLDDLYDYIATHQS